LFIFLTTSGHCQGEPVEVADLLILVNGRLTVKGDIAPGEESYPCDIWPGIGKFQ